MGYIGGAGRPSFTIPSSRWSFVGFSFELEPDKEGLPPLDTGGGSLLQSAPSFLKLRNLLHRIQTASQNQGSDRQQAQKNQNSKFTHPQPLNTLSDLRPATFDLGLSTGPKGSPNFTFVTSSATSTLRRRNHGAHRASLAGRIPDDEPDLDWFNRPRNPSESDQDCFDQSQVWKPEEIPLGDGRTLVLDDT